MGQREPLWVWIWSMKVLGEFLNGREIGLNIWEPDRNSTGFLILNLGLMNLRKITANGKVNHFWSCSLVIPQACSKALLT